MDDLNDPRKLAEQYEERAASMRGGVAMLAKILFCRATMRTLAVTTSPLGVSAYQLAGLQGLVEHSYETTLQAIRVSDLFMRAYRPPTKARLQKVTPRQIALLRVGMKDIGVLDDEYHAAIQAIGGVETCVDLDRTAFDWMLLLLEQSGFKPERKAEPREDRKTFGRRANMATPAQIELIQTLWAGWVQGDSSNEAPDLNAWLAKFHHVSALRFVDAEKAGKVINALRAMVARKPKPLERSVS